MIKSTDIAMQHAGNQPDRYNAKEIVEPPDVGVLFIYLQQVIIFPMFVYF
jgi:hypothetical protein